MEVDVEAVMRSYERQLAEQFRKVATRDAQIEALQAQLDQLQADGQEGGQ